jgi:chromosome condensin MukBEF ATPase and DNA-binding subunit MukB
MEALKAYAAEVSALREERRKDNQSHRDEVEALKKSHRADMRDMEARNRECDEDRHQLREKVDALKDLVSGLNRVIITASANKVLELGDYPSPEVQQAAQRVDQLFKVKPE